MTDMDLFADIEDTHRQEEKFRRESMSLIIADPECSRHLDTIQKAMNYGDCHRNRPGVFDEVLPGFPGRVVQSAREGEGELALQALELVGEAAKIGCIDGEHGVSR